MTQPTEPGWYYGRWQGRGEFGPRRVVRNWRGHLEVEAHDPPISAYPLRGFEWGPAIQPYRPLAPGPSSSDTGRSFREDDPDAPKTPPGWTYLHDERSVSFPRVRCRVWAKPGTSAMRAVAWMRAPCIMGGATLTVCSGACKSWEPGPRQIPKLVADAISDLVRHEILEEMGGDPHEIAPWQTEGSEDAR